MWKILVVGAAMLLTLSCSGIEPKSQRESFSVEKERPRVVLETEAGKIVLELFPDVAPNHVRNFLDLVGRGFYDSLTFHRVVKGLVIQAGSPDGSAAGNAGFSISAEFSKVPHLPGTVGMARGRDPNSASSQFYICLAQLPDLDGQFTVFGQTVEGMDIVQKIGNIETEEDPQTGETSKPVVPVRILKAYRIQRIEPNQERPY